MSVETQIKAQIDHIAAIKTSFVAAIASRSSTALWTMVDAASNVAYENRVKGTNITGIDNNVQAIEVATLFADWYRLHNEYFSLDAGLTVSGSAITTFKAAVEDYYRWRVPQYFNDIMKKALGQGIELKNVFPRHDLILGDYAATSSSAGTFTAGSDLDTTLSGPGQVGVYVINQSIGGANLVLSVTCKYEDDTTVAVAVTVPSTSVVGTKKIVGEQALTSNHTAASGNGVVLMAATSQFKVGQKVLVRDTNNQEVAEVVTISVNTSLTLKKVGGTTNALRNDYTTAASAVVVPLFKDVTAVTNSNGTNGDDVNFKFEPDRAISL